MIAFRKLGLGSLGLGSLGDCGDSPCDWTDWVWASDACLNYLGCANPSDARYVGMQPGGYVAAAGSTLGQGTGLAVSNFIKGAINPTPSGSGNGFDLNSLSSSLIMLAVIGGGIWIVAKKISQQ